MLVCERDLENAIREFFAKMNFPRPSYWTREIDFSMLKKAVPAFISALEKIEPIDFCHGFNQDNVINKSSTYEQKKCYSCKDWEQLAGTPFCPKWVIFKQCEKNDNLDEKRWETACQMSQETNCHIRKCFDTLIFLENKKLIQFLKNNDD